MSGVYGDCMPWERRTDEVLPGLRQHDELVAYLTLRSEVETMRPFEEHPGDLEDGLNPFRPPWRPAAGEWEMGDLDVPRRPSAEDDARWLAENGYCPSCLTRFDVRRTWACCDGNGNRNLPPARPPAGKRQKAQAEMEESWRQFLRRRGACDEVAS